MDEDQWLARFREAQEKVIEAWADVLDFHVTGQRGDGDRIYEAAAAELTAFLRETGAAEAGAAREVRLCQVVGCLRAAQAWQNPPISDAPGLPAFLRQRLPLVITEDMLRAP